VGVGASDEGAVNAGMQQVLHSRWRWEEVEADEREWARARIHSMRPCRRSPLGWA